MDVAHIRTTPFVSLIPPLADAPSTPPPSVQSKTPPSTPDALTNAQFQSMTLAELQSECRERGLSAKGNKATLRRRLGEE